MVPPPSGICPVRRLDGGLAPILRLVASDADPDAGVVPDAAPTWPRTLPDILPTHPGCSHRKLASSGFPHMRCPSRPLPRDVAEGERGEGGHIVTEDHGGGIRLYCCFYEMRIHLLRQGQLPAAAWSGIAWANASAIYRHPTSSYKACIVRILLRNRQQVHVILSRPLLSRECLQAAVCRCWAAGVRVRLGNISANLCVATKLRAFPSSSRQSVRRHTSFRRTTRYFFVPAYASASDIGPKSRVLTR
ncbi:uncharacterized protein V1510DRAFT_243981 [Dipodascopsis tothii]|uniref:uncharacterized protein n=1 Tax=Dipodascopsis tothii TaxID=44089 RepID=UPI0034CD5F5F